MNLCYLFSGQGSQFANMGQDLYQTETKYQQTVDYASDVLNLDLADPKNFDNPANTQIAILTMSVGIARLLDGQVPAPSSMLGLSLGEYSALVSAKALSFESGLKLVADRSKYMDEAGEKHPGKMAAVLKTDPKTVEDVCDQIDGVYPANFNTSKQTVIGGTAEGVEKATEALKAAGAKRVVPLNVAVASHTPLMQDASDKLAQRLETVDFNDPKIEVMSNTLVEPFTKSNLKSTLVEQLVNPTHFRADVEALNQQTPIDAFIEIGPGETLSKMAKKAVKGADTYHVDSVESLKRTLQNLEAQVND